MSRPMPPRLAARSSWRRFSAISWPRSAAPACRYSNLSEQAVSPLSRDRHAASIIGFTETMMIATRYAKIIMMIGLGLFGLIVALDNVIDYGTNFAFVQHVLSMDTTFPGNALTWRAITSPPLH